MNKKWKTLRCVVEVKVPPNSRISEKDLIYQVEEGLADNFSTPMDQYHMPLPRSRPMAHERFRFRVKSFGRVRQMLDIREHAERVEKWCRDWGIPIPPAVIERLKR